MNFSSLGYSYSASATNGWLFGLYVPGSGTDRALSTNSSDDLLVFTFTSGNVTAVGGYFFPTDQDGNLISGSLVLTLDDGTVHTLVNGTPLSFVGFTTAPGQWITSLTVDAQEAGRYSTVNDLYVGQGAVPEPATGGLLAGGMLLLAALARRRRDGSLQRTGSPAPASPPDSPTGRGSLVTARAGAVAGIRRPTPWCASASRTPRAAARTRSRPRNTA